MKSLKEKRENIGFDYADEKSCLAAVKQNPMTLQFVKNQTEEICLIAVKQNGLAIINVKNITPKIFLQSEINRYSSF